MNSGDTKRKTDSIKEMGIAEMSLPLLLASFFSSAIGLTDIYISGSMSAGAQAAVGIGEQFIYLSIVAGAGLCAAATACISRAVGAGQLALARAFARDSLIAACFLGLLATIVALAAPEAIYRLLGADNSVLELGAEYIRVCSYSNIPFMAMLVLSAIFRSLGKPIAALCMVAATSAISIGGAFAFTLPPCNMGIAGLGLSWFAGSMTGALIGLALYLPMIRSASAGDLDADAILSGRQRAYALLTVAVPAILGEIVYIAANFVLFRQLLAMPGGAQAQASYAVALKIEETLASMPLFAVSNATAAVIGHRLGAGKRSEALRLTIRASLVTSGAMFVVGALIACFAPQLAALFTCDSLARHDVVILLLGSPVLLPLLAARCVTTGALEGAGRSSMPAAVNSLTALVARAPVVGLFALQLQMGIVGALIGIAFARFAASAVLLCEFRRGEEAFESGLGIDKRVSNDAPLPKAVNFSIES